MEALRGRDFWFRYHFVDEDLRLDAKQQFVFPLNDRFELSLDAGPYSIYLSLTERAARQQHVLGWWDEARWHPFALRWTELLTLVRGWSERNDMLASPLPLLLLGRFVGFGVDEKQQHEEALRLVADAYRSLGLSQEDVTALSTRSLPVVNEEDYRWTHDAGLGWLFGGEYPCYSLRNRDHSGGQEGRFPFTLIQELFAETPL